MANREEIDFVFNHMMKIQPQELLKLFNDSNTGIGAVLRLLKELPAPVTAGKISEVMCVSEARVTALIKKMQNRGYVTKKKDNVDARVTIIELTDNGRNMADQLRDTLRCNIGILIDTVGMDKIKQYTQLAEEINNAIRSQLSPPPTIT